MKPITITITTTTAERIIAMLEAFEIEHANLDAGILASEIRGLTSDDREEPEPEPEPFKKPKRKENAAR